VLDQLAIHDRILIHSFGRSLALRDYPEVQLKSISPRLLDALELSPSGPNCLCVPVAAEVPAALIGAGSGLLSESGAVQIQSDDPDVLAAHGGDRLRLGDIVAIHDYDSRWGPGYRQGAMTVGVVSHGDSPRAGHGPGVTPLMTAIGGRIQAAVVEERNIATLMGIRED
jgi:hypothetical protein